MDEREESLVYTLQALRDAVREKEDISLISMLSVGSPAADQALHELRDELVKHRKKGKTWKRSAKSFGRTW